MANAAARELDRLIGAREHEGALALTADLRSGPDAFVRALTPAAAAAVALSTGTYEGDVDDATLDAVVRSALHAADDRWAADPTSDPDSTADATLALAAAARVLFHPVRHTDVARTPLLRDPAGFLRFWHSSAMVADLAAPRATERPARPSPTGTGRTRVLVLTGAYPRFAGPLVEALETDPRLEVDTLALGDRAGIFRWLGPNTAALAARVAEHPRGHGAVDLLPRRRGDAAWLGDADVVVADWADRGAAWASAVLPPDVRLVVRMHGADAFGVWAHLIDWSRVDALVHVSAPHAALTRRILGDRLDDVDRFVVPHALEPGRFAGPQAEDADRTLGLVGWAKVVKDPMWALDVLERLLTRDPSWRLLLVGDGFAPGLTGDAARYADRVESRLSGPLGRHVERVAHTEDVPAQTARMGFVLSASLRESFHLAVLEGAASGAVPVVRDWPVYGELDGPASLYPPAWVVADVDDAVARIEAHADPATRRRAATAVRAEAARGFTPDAFRDGVIRAVLG